MSSGDTFAERYWGLVCSFKHEMGILIAIVATLLVLTIVSILLADQNTDAYVVSVMNLGILGTAFVLITLCMWKCS